MFSFIFFITFSLLEAQSIRIVDAQTDKSIKNVNVFVGNKGTTTDSYGSCSLDIFEKDAKWKDEAAKKKILEYFDLLGFSDPNVIGARKKLSSLMFK